MKKLLLVIGLLFLASCAAPRMMTRERYNEVVVGQTSFDQLKQCCGQPYSKRHKTSGQTEYQWIERFSYGSTMVHENHYYITVDGEGVVILKRQEYENPPPFDAQYDNQQIFDN